MSNRMIFGERGSAFVLHRVRFRTFLWTFFWAFLFGGTVLAAAGGAGEARGIRLPDELRRTLGETAEVVEDQLEEERASQPFGPRAVAIVMSAVDVESLQQAIDEGAGRSAVRALAGLIRETDVALRRGEPATRLAAGATERVRQAVTRAAGEGPPEGARGRSEEARGGRAERALERVENGARGAPPSNRPGGPPEGVGPPDGEGPAARPDNTPNDPGDNPGGDTPSGDTPGGPPNNPGR